MIQYLAPRTDAVASLFRVDLDDDATMVSVDPYTAKVIETFPRHSGWYDFADNTHGELMLGITGDRMIETTASLTLVLVATDLYMWWPRGAGLPKTFIPNFGEGRATWKSVGIWVSVFLTSGILWSGVWGGKMVQA